LDVELVKVDNRIRKYYKITEEGLKEKVLIMDEIKEYIGIMQNILNPNWSIEL
jgi:DNA-binding PadR family transcriptional regulator